MGVCIHNPYKVYLAIDTEQADPDKYLSGNIVLESGQERKITIHSVELFVKETISISKPISRENFISIEVLDKVYNLKKDEQLLIPFKLEIPKTATSNYKISIFKAQNYITVATSDLEKDDVKEFSFKIDLNREIKYPKQMPFLKKTTAFYSDLTLALYIILGLQLFATLIIALGSLSLFLANNFSELNWRGLIYLYSAFIMFWVVICLYLNYHLNFKFEKLTNFCAGILTGKIIADRSTITSSPGASISLTLSGRWGFVFSMIPRFETYCSLETIREHLHVNYSRPYRFQEQVYTRIKLIKDKIYGQKLDKQDASNFLPGMEEVFNFTVPDNIPLSYYSETGKVESFLVLQFQILFGLHYSLRIPLILRNKNAWISSISE